MSVFHKSVTVKATRLKQIQMSDSVLQNKADYSQDCADPLRTRASPVLFVLVEVLADSVSEIAQRHLLEVTRVGLDLVSKQAAFFQKMVACI